MSQTAPWPLPCVCSRERPSGDRSIIVAASAGREPRADLRPRRDVPERRIRRSYPETARVRPSGLNSSECAPPTFWSSSRTSLPLLDVPEVHEPVAEPAARKHPAVRG